MKTIGMIGGMSWESTLEYYRLINQEVKAQLGGFHSAKCMMVSVDFHEIELLQKENDWEGAAQLLVEAARNVENGGADFLLICTNTMHKVADAVQARIQIPLLHIADPTAQAVKARGIDKIALLGTRFTMEEAFYKDRLVQDHGLQVILPSDVEMDVIHHVIYQELCLGVIQPASRDRYLKIVDGLIQEGAEGVILGCTEIGLLIKDGDSRVPFFDTTAIHAQAAVAYALSYDF
jgi:aspartate racemase